MVYTGPPPGATGSISPSFYEELKAQLLQKVRESVTNSPLTTQPFLFRYGGLVFEILESLADCQAILRRHPYTKAVQTIVIYDIPPNILARDCLNILMREAGNLGVLEGLDMVLIHHSTNT